MRRLLTVLFVFGLALTAHCRTATAEKTAAEVKGIVFCQVHDHPNGRSGLHMEQFRIIRRPTRARICSLIPARPDGKPTDLTGETFVSAVMPDLS